MKRSKAHNVYLSQQSLDILIALKTCAGNSRYLLPSRYDADAPMSRATFNRITSAIALRAKQDGLPLAPFTVHDLRRTGSTLLNELGFNRDWIEKCLAHEEGRSSRGVYNKAEYEQQRRHMLQEWADIIDAWIVGKNHKPTLYRHQCKCSLEIEQAFGARFSELFVGEIAFPLHSIFECRCFSFSKPLGQEHTTCTRSSGIIYRKSVWKLQLEIAG